MRQKDLAAQLVPSQDVVKVNRPYITMKTELKKDDIESQFVRITNCFELTQNSQKNPRTQIRFLSNQTLASIESTDYVSIFDLKTMEQIHFYSPPPGQFIKKTGYFPDTKQLLVLLTCNSGLLFFNLENGCHLLKMIHPYRQGLFFTHFELLSDNYFIASTNDCLLNVYMLRKDDEKEEPVRVQHFFTYQTNQIKQMLYKPYLLSEIGENSKGYLYASGDNTVAVYNNTRAEKSQFIFQEAFHFDYEIDRIMFNSATNELVVTDGLYFHILQTNRTDKSLQKFKKVNKDFDSLHTFESLSPAYKSREVFLQTFNKSFYMYWRKQKHDTAYCELFELKYNGMKFLDGPKLWTDRADGVKLKGIAVVKQKGKGQMLMQFEFEGEIKTELGRRQA
ncbi:hypothetical protein FGO68_gene2729 [Halteria grandinella]|uniref:Uncharacterized protein n=1 Tax=Halteria grandinella TaxID=5974 RepID=A0A8J8SVY0_HALGN|nr:hypothetical protein FGO68_gene2729 [Halteria grandinella]